MIARGHRGALSHWEFCRNCIGAYFWLSQCDSNSDGTSICFVAYFWFACFSGSSGTILRWKSLPSASRWNATCGMWDKSKKHVIVLPKQSLWLTAGERTYCQFFKWPKRDKLWSWTEATLLSGWVRQANLSYLSCCAEQPPGAQSELIKNDDTIAKPNGKEINNTEQPSSSGGKLEFL